MNPLIGIIGGHGRMGSLFAKFFQDRGVKVLISDRDTKLTNIELAQKADIVIVSVPIDLTEKVIHEILPHLRKESALMDFTSVKVPPLKIMIKAPGEVLGIHPMFGNSNPIPGQTIILCPTKKSGPLSTWIEQFFRDHGAIIEKMTAKEHDKTMALTQSLIHFADIAFADTLRRLKRPPHEILRYTGPASELKVQLAARLIDQDPGLYADIQLQNPDNQKTLAIFAKSINELAQTIRKKQRAQFIDIFNKTKKFLGPYATEAYRESSYLIDKHKEIKYKPKPLTPNRPKKTDLAILGPKNTFSDQAAANLPFPKFYANSIEEVFDLVEKQKVAAGFIPIENKLEGTVRETIDQLFLRNVHICGQETAKITHHLIAVATAKKTQITKIISHPQALAQCQAYLKKHFPKAELIPSSSTAAAAETLIQSQDKHTALIGSPKLALLPGLTPIAKNIGDQKDNQTQFILIKPGQLTVPAVLSYKFSVISFSSTMLIAFHFSADSPGSLFSVFKDFKDAKINLTKIESRPTKSSLGDYIFYLNFQGNLSEPKTQKVLAAITKKVAKLKILGTY
ncbi:prephenate dehydratase [Candidatus Gracilibacteria bacterium]|nr:prephenate dehydratase [Candidatus Gracilibacteria bacterium]